MTIRSREIALRCAASLPPRLLAHDYQHRSDPDAPSNTGLYKRLSPLMMEQLDKCKDTMAQRLILGTSK